MRLQRTQFLGLAALISMSACVDLDEEIVAGVTAGYFETAEGLEDAVDAAYSALTDHYAQERSMTMLEYGTDLFTKGADGSHKHWNDYTPQLEPATAYAAQQWDLSYRAINIANAVISRAEGIESGISEELKAQRVAEARFLRAHHYFYLVRHYGDLHITLEETEGVVVEAQRTPEAQVYSDVIIPDLEAAIATLPATQSDWGRATRGAAQHMLGLVYLTRLDAGDAARAEPLLRAVIESGVYSLEPEYVDLWCGSQSPAIACTVPSNEQKPEFIFTMQSSPDPLTRGPGNNWHLYWLMQYDIQVGMQRSIEYGRPFKRLRPTEKMLYLHDRDIDVRYDVGFQHVWLANKGDAARGLEIGDTSIYLPAVRTADLPPVYKGKAYTVVTEPDNFWAPVQLPFGDEFVNVKAEYGTDLFPALTKFQDPHRVSTNDTEGQRDFPIYRLADTYLLLAESLIRQGKLEEAVPYVNAVRERAAKDGMVEEMQVGVAEMNLDFILSERGRELFAEGHRWFDLKRFGVLVEYIRLYNLDAAPNIQDYHVLRPIPESQIDRTRNPEGEPPFEQNPGY